MYSYVTFWTLENNWRRKITTKQGFYINISTKFTDIYGQCRPGSSVGIVNVYGLYGSRIESRWGRNFLHPSRSALGPTQPPVQWVPGLSLGVTLKPHPLLVPLVKKQYRYAPSSLWAKRSV